MKFKKSLGLLCIASAMLMVGCSSSNGVTTDQEVVNSVAKNDGLVMSTKGTTYSSGRTNNLTYGTELYLANAWNYSAKVKEESGIVTKIVTASISWTITGEGASTWKTNSKFNPDETHDYYKGTYPKEGDPVPVIFTAEVTYGKASKTVVYNFNMLIPA